MNDHNQYNDLRYMPFDCKDIPYTTSAANNSSIYSTQEMTERLRDLSEEIAILEAEKYRRMAMPSDMVNNNSASSFNQHRMNELILQHRNLEYEQRRSRSYGHYHHEPRFIGGPLDGRRAEEYSNPMDGQFVFRQMKTPVRPYNQSNTNPVLDAVLVNTEEIVYRRLGDGNYYCGDMQSAEHEDRLIRDTKSDKITIADRIKLKHAAESIIWKAVRQRLKGKWKKDPVSCCRELESFTGVLSTARNSELCLVMNYLICGALRLSNVRHRCIDDLTRRLAVEIANRKIKGRW